MPKTNYLMDVSFSIETEKNFEDLTKEEILRALRKRVQSLEEHWEPDAIGWTDEYEID